MAHTGCMPSRVRQSDPNAIYGRIYSGGPSIMSGPIIARPCRYCRHWQAWVANGVHVLCDEGGVPLVRNDPHIGCPRFGRDPGSEGDDPVLDEWFEKERR